MSEILFVIPSSEEHMVLFPELRSRPKPGDLNTFRSDTGIEFNTLVTGPGAFLTTYHLGRHLTNHSPSLVVQIGICGTHDPEIGICNIVLIEQDEFTGFGAEDHSDFIDANELGFYTDEPLLKRNDLHYSLDVSNHGSLNNLPFVKGITVFKATGSAHTAGQIVKKYGRVIETMEGAAFYYCCNQQQINCIQIRAVSNIAGPRDRGSWKIESSLKGLRDYIERTFYNTNTTDES